MVATPNMPKQPQQPQQQLDPYSLLFQPGSLFGPGGALGQWFSNLGRVATNQGLPGTPQGSIPGGPFYSNVPGIGLNSQYPTSSDTLTNPTGTRYTMPANPSDPASVLSPEQSNQQTQQLQAQGFRQDPNNPQLLWGPDGRPYGMGYDGQIHAIQDPLALAQLQGQQAQSQLQQQGQNALDLVNAQGANSLAERQLQGSQAVTLQDLVNQGQINLANTQGNYGLQNTNAQIAGNLASTALTTSSQQAIAQINNDAAQKIAQLQADNSLSLSDKETQRTQIQADAQGQVATIQAQSVEHAHQIDAELGKYTANLQLKGVQLQEQTKRAIADQNYDVALRNIASMQQIEHEKRLIEQEQVNLGKYTADLNAQTSNKQTAANLLSSVLGMQSQERMGRTNAAVNFFGQLAQMAPQQNLVNAFYLMRGQAPPPSIAQTAMPLMNQVLGGNQAQAAVQASGVNNATFAPFLQDILGVKAVPAAVPAGAAA